MEHQPRPERPERSLVETESRYAPSLDDIATMHRALAWIRQQGDQGEIELEDEQEDGIESLGGLVEAALIDAVTREPELAASMVDAFSGSPNPIDRGLACDLLGQYHRQLITQDTVNDARLEMGRWQRLVSKAIPGHERNWFQAAAGFVVEHAADRSLSERSQAFVDGLRDMATDE